jgi:ribosomal protein S18 acetylase RimI-like enzyme
MTDTDNSERRMIVRSIALRDTVTPDDVEHVRRIVRTTGFFHDHEMDVAVELVRERLNRGIDSGYHFLFADLDGATIGYACYGPIACTAGSYDLYWIAVDPECQSKGIGRVLLRACEARMAEAGGRHVYVETSSRTLYEPTRAFYQRCGYSEAARLADFYADGDAKVIYVRAL